MASYNINKLNTTRGLTITHDKSVRKIIIENWTKVCDKLTITQNFIIIEIDKVHRFVKYTKLNTTRGLLNEKPVRKINNQKINLDK